MAMKLEKIVPFGRSLDEYTAMFALSDDDLMRSVAGIGDGPASFNAELTEAGKRVVSFDPLYACCASDIRPQFEANLETIITQVKATANDWSWSFHRSPQQLKMHRVQTFHRFLLDYQSTQNGNRYVAGALPALGVVDDAFELALCSHFLFLYSEHLTYAFHRDSIYEMLRIAADIRIFPLLTLDLQRSPYLQPLVAELESAGHTVSIDTVAYEFQRGGNQMLRIQRAVT